MRRNNFPDEQIPQWFLLLSENLSASYYPGAAMSLNASGVRDTARSLHICPNTVLRELKKKEMALEAVNLVD